MSGYSDFGDFREQVLSYRSGPLVSPTEEIADEMYHSEVQEEFSNLWDKVDSDE